MSIAAAASTTPALPLRPPVERLICASIALPTERMYAQMELIRESAMRHNPPQGIHAVLLYQSGWFIHWAEGPADPVAALMERVRADARHYAQCVVHRSQGQRYLPTPWSMMLGSSTEPANVMGERVQAMRDAVEQGRRFSPTSTIRRLVAPLRLPDMAHRADTDSFHRVGVCSASANEAFDLVHWLGAQHDEPTAQRRFAGEIDMDSASEAVEFLQDGVPCRVIAVSRQGLLHGVRRAFLPDWGCLLLLFGGDTARDNALMDRVREACAGLPITPRLLGIAPDAATHQRMVLAAQQDALDYANLGEASPQDCAAIWRGVRSQLRLIGPPRGSDWATL